MKYTFYATLDLPESMKNMNDEDVRRAVELVLGKINNPSSSPYICAGNTYKELSKDTKLGDEELIVYVPAEEEEPLYIVNNTGKGHSPDERIKSIDPIDFNYDDYVATELHVTMARINRYGTAIESSIDDFAKAKVGEMGFAAREDMRVFSEDTGDDGVGEFWIVISKISK